METNRRILIIDDDLNLIEHYKDLLTFETDLNPDIRGFHTPYNFEVKVTFDGIKGHELVKEGLKKHRPFAVAFIDMRMPGWNGLTTAKAIRDLDDRIMIVIITGYLDTSVYEIQKLLQHDVFYLCKPINNNELIQIAQTLCVRWNRDYSLKGNSNHTLFEFSPADEEDCTEHPVMISGITEKAKVSLNNTSFQIRTFPFYIGRQCSKDNGAALTDKYLNIADEVPYNISRVHLSINYFKCRFYVLDRGSSLGTIVNGYPIGGLEVQYKCDLKNGENTVIVGNETSPYSYRVII